MKLFILAAGKGTRLWPLTKDKPKSLLDLGDGSTLLERQINNAINSKIFDEIIIITGYLSEQIEKEVEKYKEKINITIIYNPFYELSNNLMSLWSAHYRMIESDFMITNGDNIYQNSVFYKVYKNFEKEKEVIGITIDYKDKYDEDDMKVTLNDYKNVLYVHKQIPTENTHAESVGLALVKGEKSRNIFVNAILEMVKDKTTLNKFWLDIFNFLIKKGITVRTVEIDQDEWREVDFHPDIETLKNLIINNKF